MCVLVNIYEPPRITVGFRVIVSEILVKLYSGVFGTVTIKLLAQKCTPAQCTLTQSHNTLVSGRGVLLWVRRMNVLAAENTDSCLFIAQYNNLSVFYKMVFGNKHFFLSCFLLWNHVLNSVANYKDLSKCKELLIIILYTTQSIFTF